MELKEVTLHGSKKFTIYASPMGGKRLRCMLGGDSCRPEAIIKQLVAQKCDARLEEDTNACGECASWCSWNSCFSVPLTELEEVICHLRYAAERLYGKCEYITITVTHLSKSYELIWWQKDRKLRYFNFDGIDDSLLNRFNSSSKFLQVKPLDYEDKRVVMIMKLKPKTNLMDALQEVVSLAMQNGH